MKKITKKMKIKRIKTLSFLFFITFHVFSQNVIGWKFSLQDKGNGVVEIVADATVQNGWHMYDSNIPENGPFPTSINFDELKGAEKIGEFESTGKKPHVKFDDVFGMEIGTFDNNAKFVQKIRITDKAKFAIAGDVRAQACDDTNCTPPLPTEFKFTATDLPASVTTAAATADNTEAVDEPAQIEEEQQKDSLTNQTIVVATTNVDKEMLWAPVVEELNAGGTENK